MTRKKPPIQYHAEEYIGGDVRALAVCQWLNARRRDSQNDPVEQLVRLNETWKAGIDLNRFTGQVRKILRGSRLRLVPVWFVPFINAIRKSRFSERGYIPHPVTDYRRWGIAWDPNAPGMKRAQSLALRSVLELAADGLLNRIRQCDREECNVWFYAQKINRRFHSENCQQWVLRHDPEWQERHAREMRRRRAEAKKSKHRKEQR